MSEVRISLGNVRNTRSVYIEELDTAFTVRKLGSGEELDLSSKYRRLGEILEELRKIDFTQYDINKKADKEKVEKLQKKAEALTDELHEIQQFELDTFKRCFETEDKSKVDELINQLSAEERGKLFTMIFGEIKPIEAPDDEVEAEAEPDTNNADKTADNAPEKAKSE